MLYVVEWTHDDGMDQHQEFVDVTREQADEIRSMLEARGAAEPYVYEPTTIYVDQLLDEIRTDLPYPEEV